MIDTVQLGDCMSLMRDMDDNSVHMTLTDIPYGECNEKLVPKGGTPYFNDIVNKGKADNITFELEPFVNEVVRVTSGSIYIFCGIQQVSPLYELFKKHAPLALRLCHWEKTNPIPMHGKNKWLSATENCVFGKKPGAVFNEHCESNVWRYAQGTDKRVHPTQKPMGLMARLIEASSRKGEIVFDPCCGSGTTLCAAIARHRRFMGIEIDAKWYRASKARTIQAIEDDMFCLQS